MELRGEFFRVEIIERRDNLCNVLKIEVLVIVIMLGCMVGTLEIRKNILIFEGN